MGKELVVIVIAYLLGSFCTGYYLVLAKTGQDIRETGSGGVGARNVGRLLGPAGFLTTLLGDGLKGSAAVLIGQMFSGNDTVLALILLAVVAGHIWPLRLQFRGGRGVATAIGAYLTINPFLALALLIITATLMIFRQGFVLSGLAAFVLLPFVALFLHFSGYAVTVMETSSIIILFAHRERLRRVFAKF
ncbi:glycerol-3-phosphate acyltransferase [Desulforhopalus singaporensis]|uniref:Glycerol-3-phosphate acyltransferase n=1 Tax=Desulforhopalus singaporensis TaxID=91360 RepID=A0A1H0LUM5_9BACT|nr:glycerol-3-phosphate acyltransferase [Desulforhopalus singaporensis]SDO71610.1 glycerol-3-phosphate acyltransferase PlsY [Desulforhopalus singaporensis]